MEIYVSLARSSCWDEEFVNMKIMKIISESNELITLMELDQDQEYDDSRQINLENSSFHDSF